MSSLDQAMACHQANIWTNDGLLSIVQLGKHFNDKVNQTTNFSLNKLIIMEALKGHVIFKKKFLYLLIRTYASPN